MFIKMLTCYRLTMTPLSAYIFLDITALLSCYFLIITPILSRYYQAVNCFHVLFKGEVVCSNMMHDLKTEHRLSYINEVDGFMETGFYMSFSQKIY